MFIYIFDFIWVDMFRSFFRLALRNIKKYKLYSAISVISLTIGFCAYILISLYVSYEYTWTGTMRITTASTDTTDLHFIRSDHERE